MGAEIARLRVILVGAGGVTRYWLPPLLRRAEVVAVVDSVGERAHRLSQASGLTCPVFEDMGKAMTVDADLVANLTPPAAHREVIEAGLRAGYDVLTEKPFALTVADAQAMVELARTAGRRLAVTQNRRYQPAIRRMREGIDTGAIGAPVQLGADQFMANRHDKQYLLREPHPLLVEMAVHTFDQARYLAGADPVAVSCHEFNPRGSWFHGAAGAVATFEMEDGIAFSFRGNWAAEGLPTSFDSAWRISGTDGSVVWDSFGAPACERAAGVEADGSPRLERVAWEPSPERDFTGHAACLDAIFDALEAGAPLETSGADNLMTMAMVDAAIVSAVEGRRVTIASRLAEYHTPHPRTPLPN